MAVYRPDIPPHVAEVIRHLPPDIKRSVKQALRSLSADLISGVPHAGVVRTMEIQSQTISNHLRAGP